MTTTEELRRLLDERGVEWTYSDGTVSYDNGEHWCYAWSYNNDSMCVSMGCFTPEQVIAATLGRGAERTCHDLGSGGRVVSLTYRDTFQFSCSECGGVSYIDEHPCFCPYCGAKVVE